MSKNIFSFVKQGSNVAITKKESIVDRLKRSANDKNKNLESYHKMAEIKSVIELSIGTIYENRIRTMVKFEDHLQKFILDNKLDALFYVSDKDDKPDNEEEYSYTMQDIVEILKDIQILELVNYASNNTNLIPALDLYTSGNPLYMFKQYCFETHQIDITKLDLEDALQLQKLIIIILDIINAAIINYKLLADELITEIDTFNNTLKEYVEDGDIKYQECKKLIADTLKDRVKFFNKRFTNICEVKTFDVFWFGELFFKDAGVPFSQLIDDTTVTEKLSEYFDEVTKVTIDKLDDIKHLANAIKILDVELPDELDISDWDDAPDDESGDATAIKDPNSIVGIDNDFDKPIDMSSDETNTDEEDTTDEDMNLDDEDMNLDNEDMNLDNEDMNLDDEDNTDEMNPEGDYGTEDTGEGEESLNQDEDFDETDISPTPGDFANHPSFANSPEQQALNAI